MKDCKNNLTTLLIVFIVLKLVDFDNVGVLDIIIFILLGVDAVVTILAWRKRK